MLFNKLSKLFCIIAMLVASTAQADLVAHWNLDNNANDSANSHNGTPTGGVTFDGTSATFANGSIDVPFSSDLNPASFSVSLWANLTGGSGHRSAITSRLGPAGSQSGYILYAMPDNTWNFWTGSPGTWQQLSGGPVSLNTWTHLTLTYDAATQTKKIYVNGGEAGSVVTNLYNPNPSQAFHIGGGGDTGADFRFVGGIDDVGVWNVALTPSEITTVMNDGVTDTVGVTPPIVYGNDLTIHNGSFEDVTNPASDFNSAGSGHVANWFNITNGAISNDGANVGSQVSSPTASAAPQNFTAGLDGARAGHINSNGAIRSLVQNLDAAFTEGAEYTLDLNIGRRVDHDDLNIGVADWIVSFHHQETGDLIASIDGTTIFGQGGILSAHQLIYTATAADDGKGIQVRLTNPSTQPGFNAVNFDQVSLSVVIPEPGTLALLGLSFALFTRKQKRN